MRSSVLESSVATYAHRVSMLADVFGLRARLAIGLLLVQVFVLWCPAKTLAEDAASDPVRIGVYVRLGYQSCIDSWLPVAEYLSKTIPEHRFVIVPLASRQELLRSLDDADVAFVALNPALGIVASDRHGASLLATMVLSDRGQTKPPPSNATYGGAIIRRSDRSDIVSIEDLRHQRLAAVKPWSFAGWIMQWNLLAEHGIKPYKDLEEVVFEGTHEQVVQSVLDGSADAGTIAADLLDHLARNGRVPKNSLYIFNRQGEAVPLVVGDDMAATVSYPGWAFAKAAATSDTLARRVTDALMNKSVDVSIDEMPYQIGWTVPSSYGTVRRVLQDVMGPNFVESDGYPAPEGYPAWMSSTLVVGVALALLAVALVFLRRRYRRREELLEEQLEHIHMELLELRAQKQRLDIILARAGCGIDIVDAENHVVYADSSLERRYGDWHGQMCHEYFCDSDTPCGNCRRPSPTDEGRLEFVDSDDMQWMPDVDSHAAVHFVDGKKRRMIGIPFRDEGGRWLYARIHFPLQAPADVEQPA